MTASPLIRFMLSCHKCRRDEEAERAQREWLRILVAKDGGFLQTQLCPDCAGKLSPKTDRYLYLRWWLRNIRIGELSDRLAPGYGSCGRCETNWQFVDGHSTDFGDGSGAFPLCELCWAELDPIERLPYYRTLYDQDPGRPPWPVWERAVLAEEGSGHVH